METKSTNTGLIAGLLVLTLVLAGGLVLLAVRPVQAQTTQSGQTVVRQVSVSGSGEVKVKPDIASVQLGVETRAVTTTEALSQNNQQMAALIAKLKELGVKETDIQTSGLNINAEYNQDGRQVTGYVVSNTVGVTIRNLEQAGTLLDQVVQVGANRVYGISFGVNDPSALEVQARDKAVADAKVKAEQLAKASGATLGNVLVITDQSSARPVPVPMMALDKAAGGAVPIQAGEQTVSTQVQVSWELR